MDAQSEESSTSTAEKDPAMFGRIVSRSEAGKPAKGYAVVDVETTGVTDNDKIVQIAIVTLDPDGNEEDTFTAIVNPGIPINPEAEAVHGISDRMVAFKPTFPEIAKEVAELIEGRVFVAHNLRFDKEFVDREMSLSGHPFPADKACTLSVSRLMDPDAEEHRLEILCRDRGIVLEKAHDALEDCVATAKLAKHFIDKGVALEACEFDEEAYFRYCTIGDTRPVSKPQKSRMFGMCASAGFKTQYGKFDYPRIKAMLANVIGHSYIDGINREQMQLVYDHLEVLIEAHKNEQEKKVEPESPSPSF